jgi:hypothetical protein
MADTLTNTTLDVWRAEILARQGRGEAALEVYRSVIATAGAPAALDGALTLIDNGHDDEAAELLEQARNLARKAGLEWIERRAERLRVDRLARLDQ